MTKSQLEKLTKSELIALAKERKVNVREKDKKAVTLMKLVRSFQAEKARKKKISTEEFNLEARAELTPRQKSILEAVDQRKVKIKADQPKLQAKYDKLKLRAPDRAKVIRTKLTGYETELSDLDFIIYEITELDSRKSYKVGRKSFISPRIKNAKAEQKKAAQKMIQLDRKHIQLMKKDKTEEAKAVKKEMKKYEKEYKAQNDTLHATAASKTNAIKVRGMDAFYGPKQALYNISMDFPKNEIVAIIGPSGCGKSTFLRTLNRINDEIPSFRFTGHVMFDGNIDIATRMNIDTGESVPTSEIRSRIGMVFQQPNPFPMSIYKNVTYGPRINGEKNKAVLNDIVERSLKGAAIWDEVKTDLKKLGTALSGGQQQRLCIARAIANRPDVLLMDEPTSALDPIAAKKVEQLILELKKEYTIIMVTHSMAQAQRISDRTAFFYEGELIEYDETKKIFKNAKHKRTRDYVSGKFG